MGSVVVLGGYGNFGRRIVAALASDANAAGHRVLIAGRSRERAERFAREVGGNAEPFAVDCHAPSFAEALARADAKIVIHTAGPFQTQDYAVPHACIEARAHYVDLADARAFVCGIRALDDAAKRSETLVVSGASSLPALSSAVVDRLARDLSSIHSIEHVITSGAIPPGLATMSGVLSYAGKPFERWHDGRWRRVHGWQDLKWMRFPDPLGLRCVANCDVPDLDLFPHRYPSVESVVFRAGVAQPSSMLAIGLGAWAVRSILLSSLVPFVPRLHRLATARARRGSKHSAMRVHVRGLNGRSQPHTRTWTLIAANDHGPHIPCFPAIALARKLLRDAVPRRGAMPCMGLLDLEEILAVGRGLEIAVVEDEVDERSSGPTR